MYGALVMLSLTSGMNLMTMGTGWVEDGKVPAALGLWWLVLPLLVFCFWMYVSDGRLKAPARKRTA